MATTPWVYPVAYAINGTTYIKDTDNNITSAMTDLENWINSTGTYTTTGLAQSMVDLTTAQTIAGIKTFSDTAVFTTGLTGNVTGNLTGAVTGNADTATTLTSLTSTVTELNTLDGYLGSVTEFNYLKTLYDTTVTNTEYGYLSGVTSSIQTQISDKLPLGGGTVTGQIKGITPVGIDDLTRKDYVDGEISGLNLSSGTYTPTVSSSTNVTSISEKLHMYSRIGNVVTVSGAITFTPTSTGAATIKFNFPIASSITNAAQVKGSAGTNNSNTFGYVGGDITGNQALLWIQNDATAATSLAYTFMYEVV